MLKLLLLFVFCINIIHFSVYAKEQGEQVKIPAFKAYYNILRQSDVVGTAIRELKYLENGLAKYSYRTELEWLIFSDERQETSLINIDRAKVTPLKYEFIRTGTGKDKHYKWQFDIKKNHAFNTIKHEDHIIDFPENIQDKLSYHFQHRLNMIKNSSQEHYVYPVIGTSGKIKNYVYQYNGTEDIMLPYGLVKTIKLKREVIEKKRVTYAWFAPELDYLLVKLYQSKAGTEQFQAQLKSIEKEK